MWTTRWNTSKGNTIFITTIWLFYGTKQHIFHQFINHYQLFISLLIKFTHLQDKENEKECIITGKSMYFSHDLTMNPNITKSNSLISKIYINTPQLQTIFFPSYIFLLLHVKPSSFIDRVRTHRLKQCSVTLYLLHFVLVSFFTNLSLYYQVSFRKSD